MAGHATLMEPRRDDFVKQTLLGLVFLSCCGLALLPESMLLWFACLRENRAFWTNAGGYSLSLRDAVLFFFYPLLVVNLLVLVGLTVAFVATLRPPVSMIVLKLSALLVCWGVFSGAIAVSGSNNLMNLLEGRPLHQHRGS